MMKQKLDPAAGTFANASTKSIARQALERAVGLGDLPATRLVSIVARARGVTDEELFHHSRSCAPIAATRQLAMYLMHVVLGRTLTDVGLFFCRDRTTVSYACGLVEDMREDPAFEQEVSHLEAMIEQGGFLPEPQHRSDRGFGQ